MAEALDDSCAARDIADSLVRGNYRRRVGDITVTALNDGYFELPLTYFSGIDAGEGERLLRGASPPVPPRIDVNAFLIEAGSKRILVDTGCGSKLGPTVNRLRQNLATAGVSETSI